MRLGIDASGIRAGGGLTHLSEVLRAVPTLAGTGFQRVILWGGRNIVEALPEEAGVEVVHIEALDGGLRQRLSWQRTELPRLAEEHCDLLFVPGGTYLGRFRPFVTMSQNLLPFDTRELRRYGFSKVTARLVALRYAQLRTFRRAAGTIYLTGYARSVVVRSAPFAGQRSAVIPHGIDPRFRRSPRPQQPVAAHSFDAPMRLLYVSIVDVYKHQWYVSEAVAGLRREGLPVSLDLVGPAYPPALRRLESVLNRVDPRREFITYRGSQSFGELHQLYHSADVFVFASSCETFGQILLEAMAAGLPIASSDRSALPEVLGDSGVYFDPEQPDDIARALRTLVGDPSLRAQLAERAYERARQYSWERCARSTFAFIRSCLGEQDGRSTS